MLTPMPPTPTTSPLFPYTTLFRSQRPVRAGQRRREARAGHLPVPLHAARLDARRDPGRAGLGAEPAASPTAAQPRGHAQSRSEEHTSELQSRGPLVFPLLLEKKKE